MLKGISRPISLHNFKVEDEFWKSQMELVRKEVLPYQWEILNDRVKDAAPSFCMRNFKVAGKLMQEKRQKGADFIEPAYTFRGFEALPEDMNHLEDKFYGFVFQDSDFSKWIEAVAYSLTNHPDPDLEKIADEAIDIVCAAQQENGYLDTYYIINGMDKIFTNLRDHHELYCFGHLVEGAVAYYQATGKDKLLQAAMRFADFIDGYFGADEGKCKGYPGHEIAEMALVRLYEVTGEDKYLKLSKFFLDERGVQPYYFEQENHPNMTNYFYHQAHLPVREQEEATGHAVRAVYLYSGMADMARITGDERMWEACKKLWKSATREKMYITGGIGGTHLGEAFSYPFDLPNDTTYAETCASIGLMFFARRMLELEANSEYADVMETALYNTVLSGMALDGKSFFYVNPLEVLPEACHKDERKFHVKPVRQKWFGCACCPPNLARLLSSIPAYAYTESEDTVFVHLYIGGDLVKEVGEQEASFHISAGFPWKGSVSVEYTSDDAVEMSVALRIPQWCKKYKLCGAEGKQTRVEKGYLYITGLWSKADKVCLDLEMKPRFVKANQKVRETIGKVALVCGPVVYCLEEVDNGKNMHLLEVCTDASVEGYELKETTVGIDGQIFPAYVARGKRIVTSGDDLSQEQQNSDVYESNLYYEDTSEEYEDVELTYIPYYVWANRGENEMSVWMRKWK